MPIGVGRGACEKHAKRGGGVRNIGGGGGGGGGRENYGPLTGLHKPH